MNTVKRTKPIVAPKLNTVDNVMLYIRLKYHKEIENSPDSYELYNEATKENGCAKYLNELTKEHLDKKDKYFDTQIELDRERIRHLKTYIIEPKVKGQINLAKQLIKKLKEEIASNIDRKRYWGIPY
jgi:hypothetical protein